MIIYLCMKYESNTLIFSKDIERKLFSYGTYGRTDSGDTICSPIENGGGIDIYILFVCVWFSFYYYLRFRGRQCRVYIGMFCPFVSFQNVSATEI